jgi:hypothetical protein
MKTNELTWSLNISIPLSTRPPLSRFLELFIAIMIVIPSLSVLLALLPAVLALPAVDNIFSRDVTTTVVERINAVPKGWTKHADTVDKDGSITLRIHLKQQDMDKFHDLAMKVRFLVQETKCVD